MAIELLQMNTQEFLRFINKFPHLGDITVMDHDDVEGNVQDLRVGDVCLFYDYCTDDCSKAELNEFYEWMSPNDYRNKLSVFDIINQFMDEQGYEEIETVDGSGNGLHYGVIQYRKA